MAYIDIFERSFHFVFYCSKPSYRTVPAGDQAPWVGLTQLSSPRKNRPSEHF